MDLTPNPAVVGMSAGQLRASARNWDTFAATIDTYPSVTESMENEAIALRLQAEALDASPHGCMPEDFDPHRYLYPHRYGRR